ncbi:MAG: hypothetical protein ACI9QD_000594 [Thermoproteota archaeon]
MIDSKIIEPLAGFVSTNFSNLLMIQIFLVVLVIVLFVGLWVYNKKKYQNLKHQIPATVVKSYLDSIIQNSTAIKSSLFRGGGLDLDASNIPSVLPLSDLPSSTSASLSNGGASIEELNLKNSEIAKLRAELADKQTALGELENKTEELNGIIAQRDERIVELERLLAAANAAGGGDSAAMQGELDKAFAERDELKAKLDDYAVISEDLADLKRYKQENVQLKKALEDAGGTAPAVDVTPEQVPEPVAEPTPEPPALEPEAIAPEPVVEEAATAEPGPVVEAAAEAPEAPADSSGDDDNRSPEDLLSEFEKMLE